MSRYPVWIIVLALIAAGAAVAADGPIKLDGLSVKGWTVANGPRTLVGPALDEKIDDSVAFHRDVNLVDTQWLLLKADGRKLDVFVFSYDTPANAFGQYTVMRRSVTQAGGAEPVDVADEAMFHPMGKLVAWAGRSCILVTAASPEPPGKRAFVAVAEKLAAQLVGDSARPELVRALPDEDLDDSSIVYCHYRQALEQVFDAGGGNVLRLGEDLTAPTQVEAVYAEYQIDDRPHKLIAVRYPEESEASQAAQAFGEAQAAGARSDQTAGPWRDIEMLNGRHTLIHQSGKLLAFSPEAASKEAAQRLIESLTNAFASPPTPAMMQGG